MTEPSSHEKHAQSAAKLRDLTELRSLLIAFTSDEADNSQTKRLSDLMENPTCAAEAASMLEQQSALRDACLGDRDLRRGSTDRSFDVRLAATRFSERAKPASQPSSRWFARLSAIAAALLITHGLFAYVGWQRGSMRRDALPTAQLPAVQLPAAQLPAVPIAGSPHGPQLVSMTGCVWEATDQVSPVVGQSLRQGEVLTLIEGIAELDLGESSSELVRVRIEGPASIFVRADGKLGIRYGSLTADMAGLREPFAFDTPLGRVEVTEHASLGIVAGDATNEVHVFSGQVAVSSERVVSDTPVATVSAGQGVRLSANEARAVRVEPIVAAREAFASTRSMAFDSLVLDDRYRRVVLESQPQLYWQFDVEGNEVTNLGSVEGLKGYLDGEVSWPRFGENRAIEFGLNPSPGAFITNRYWPAENLASYAIEFWAKPSHFHSGAAVSLVGRPQTDGRHPHGVLIEFCGPFPLGSSSGYVRNGIRFLHRNPISADSATGVSCLAESSYKVREWQHIVANKEATKLTLYVDGKPIASAADTKVLPAGLQLVIGQLFPLHGTRQYTHGWLRPFVGQVDEVALYDRALEESEIYRHFETGCLASGGEGSI